MFGPRWAAVIPSASLEPELVERAKSELAELTLRISTLTLTTPSEASGVDAPIRVSLDGAEIAVDLLQRGLPVDPGEHQVVITAPGKAARRLRALRIRVRVGEGQQVRVDPELSPR